MSDDFRDFVKTFLWTLGWPLTTLLGRPPGGATVEVPAVRAAWLTFGALAFVGLAVLAVWGVPSVLG